MANCSVKVLLTKLFAPEVSEHCWPRSMRGLRRTDPVRRLSPGRGDGRGGNAEEKRRRHSRPTARQNQKPPNTVQKIAEQKRDDHMGVPCGVGILPALFSVDCFLPLR